jgi:hypothetical protein
MELGAHNWGLAPMGCQAWPRANLIVHRREGYRFVDEWPSGSRGRQVVLPKQAAQPAKDLGHQSRLPYLRSIHMQNVPSQYQTAVLGAAGARTDVLDRTGPAQPDQGLVPGPVASLRPGSRERGLRPILPPPSLGAHSGRPPPAYRASDNRGPCPRSAAETSPQPYRRVA